MYLLKRNWYVTKIVTAVAGGVAADDPMTLDTIVTSRPILDSD